MKNELEFIFAPSQFVANVKYKTQQMTRLDGDETIFFQRELETVKARTYDTKYPNLQFASGQLIPISNEAGPGTREIVYQQYTELGMAKIISNYASDLPRASVKAEETRVKVRDLGVGFDYSVMDIKAAAKSGKPLNARLASAAKRAMMMALDEIAVKGDSSFGLVGLLSHPNIPEVTIPADGTGSSKTWTSKTPAQILRDLNLMVSSIIDVTKGIENPDTLLMPIAQYELISNTPRSDHSDKTIKNFFLENNGWIKNIIPVNKLKDAVDGDDVIIAYNRNPENLTLEIPDSFQMLEVQQQNLAFKVPCLLTTGGVIVYYPLTVAKGMGI